MTPAPRSDFDPSRRRTWMWWGLVGLVGFWLLMPSAATADDVRYRAFLQYRPKDGAPFTGDCGNRGGALQPGTYRVQVMADSGSIGTGGGGRSVLGFGVSLNAGEAISTLTDLNADALNDSRSHAANTPVFWPPPLSITQGTIPLVRELAQFNDVAPRVPLLSMLRLLCRDEARPLGDSGPLVLIHRLLAAGTALSARDVADLWAFYAPGLASPPEAADRELLALARRNPGFLFMADYGGRTSARHRELHDAFVAALAEARIAGPAVIGSVAPEPLSNPPQPDGVDKALVDRRIHEAMTMHWNEVVRPPLTVAVVVALLALAATLTLLALLLKMRAAVAKDLVSFRRRGNEQNNPSSAMESLRQKQSDDMNRMDAAREDLERQLADVIAGMKDLHWMVEQQSRAAERGSSERVQDEFLEWRRTVDSKLFKVEQLLSTAARSTQWSDEVDAPLRLRSQPSARSNQAAADTAPSVDRRFGAILRLAGQAGVRSADLAALERRMAQLGGAPQLIAKDLIALLPPRPDPAICLGLGRILAEISDQACELILPMPDTHFNGVEHEIGEYEPARRGDLNQVVALLRPGLRINGQVSLKARVSVPN